MEQERARRNELAAVFGHPGVADAYRHRPPARARWRATLTRLAAMTGHAYLAIVDHGHRDLPWQAGLTEIIVRHSRSPGYDPASR
jgi:hypothetical protein